MLSAIIALAIFGSIALGWMSARAASELASHYGRRACEESRVQWLDHTVMLERISLRRAADGWIRPLRRYRFDFSTNGHDRHRDTWNCMDANCAGSTCRRHPKRRNRSLPAAGHALVAERLNRAAAGSSVVLPFKTI